MKKSIPLFLFTLILLTLAACSHAQPEIVEVTRVVTEVVEMAGEVVEVEVTRVTSTDVIAATPIPLPTASPAATRPATTAKNVSQPPPAPRMIIKTGQLDITVEDTETAVDTLTTTIIDAGGYIVSQRVWEQNNYTYATLSLGVPVDLFEQLMRTIGTLGDVTNEVASGQDVTDEYVDLESRLGNLQATQDRLRTFLEEAQNVEEILAVNSELSKVEEELEVIQGRMSYLTDRAAFSTINVTLNPYIPPPPTPTPTPIPTAASWSPGSTAQLAAVNLQESAQSAADFTIYNLITRGPWLLLFALPLALIWRTRRRSQSVAQSPAASDKED